MNTLPIQNTPASLPAVKPAAARQQAESPAVPKLVTEAAAADKSVLSGAVRGGLATAGIAAIPSLLYIGAQSGGVSKLLSMYIVGTAVGTGAVAGALAGAVSSQISTQPFGGAGVGAVVGAAAGALTLGLVGRGVNAAIVG
ncbi:MAG: hypothetical protein CVV27_09340, partial [Candidatus Melainabacteria bacterium HGW-Melainabacteria-1]